MARDLPRKPRANFWRIVRVLICIGFLIRGGGRVRSGRQKVQGWPGRLCLCILSWRCAGGMRHQRVQPYVLVEIGRFCRAGQLDDTPVTPVEGRSAGIFHGRKEGGTVSVSVGAMHDGWSSVQLSQTGADGDTPFVLPRDLGGLVCQAVETARQAGLDQLGQIRRAVGAVRAARPDLTGSDAFKAVILLL